LTWASDYLRWSKKSIGSRFFGAVVAGAYRHPEVMSQDPYALDRAILSVHPFIKLWAEDSKAKTSSSSPPKTKTSPERQKNRH
jgi:hypothetical protein